MATTLKPWVPATHDDYDRLVGMDVYTRDGVRSGRIKDV